MLYRSTRFRARFATVLAVLASLIFFGLAPAHAEEADNASISGTVTAPAGVDLARIWISAESTAEYRGTQPDSEGHFTVSGLPAGSYKVHFSGNDSGAVDGWYGGASSSEGATEVLVGSGQALTGINATLDKGASVSGKITGAAGVDVAQIGVSAWQPDGYLPRYSQVDADGNYKIVGLPAGTFTVKFDGRNAGALDQWYPAASSFESAKMFTLTAGQELSGIDAAMVKGASITGTVTAPAGVDLSTVGVTAWPTSGMTNNSLEVHPDETGRYVIKGLPRGSYKVQFASYQGDFLEQWYANATSFEGGTTVTMADGEDVVGIDAALLKGASISGKVTVPAGVDYSAVSVYVQSEVGWIWRYAEVDTEGHYSVSGLPAGRYKVQFTANGTSAMDQWYGGGTSPESAVDVVVAADQDVSGIDATLLKGASISGKITAPDGVDISAVSVEVESKNEPSSAGKSVRVDPDGRYRVQGLSSGSYTVRFSPGDSGALDLWYPNAASETSATAVSVESEQDVTGIDATLVKGATVSGKITIPAGFSPNSLTVQISTMGPGRGSSNITNVENDGSYKFIGLYAGDYVVEVTSFRTGLLDLRGSNGIPIKLETGQDLSGVNATMTKGASISGKVSAPAEVDLTSVRVIVTQEDGSTFAGSSEPRSDGSYEINGLAAGSYKVSFAGQDSGSLSEWYDNVPTADKALPITLQAGQDRTGVDAILALGGSVSGKVNILPDFNPIESYYAATIFQAGDINKVVGRASIGSDGHFTLRGLPTGSYKILFSSYNTGALDRWYGDADNFGAATPITVAAGQAITAADTTLIRGATVSGKVTAPETMDLRLTRITAYPDGVLDGAQFSSQLAADGSYKIVGLPAGSYKLKFDGGSSGATDLWYGGSNLATASMVTVATSQDRTGIDLTAIKGASLSGKVSGLDGVRYPVDVLDPAGKTVKNGYTDASGAFSVVGLAEGSYKVAFNRSSGYAQEEAQFYDNKPESSGPAQAAPIAVASGQSVDGINASLVQGGSITGTATDKAGKPIAGAWVQAYTLDGSLVTRNGATDFTGKFTIPGLTTGKYIVVLHSNLGKLYSGNTASETSATQVDVVSGKASVLDLAYASGTDPLTAPVPTITGTAKVGATLTAVPGTWAPAPVTLAYQWKANGAAISGATASTYKPAAADLGKAITVTVTGSKTGYTTAEKTSAATAPVVAADQILTAPVPTITGTAKVGATLTAVPGTWAPAPVTLAYQWKANGAAISGATASTYKPAAADLGKTITVSVTGSKTGYTTAEKTSAATAPVVAAGQILTAPVPTITGTAKVGATLTAVPGTWAPSPVTLAYQWKANGAAISGATASTYKLAAADLGKAITVTVTGSKSGYTTAAKTSAATGAVGAGALATAVPAISGTAKVGATLTAVPGTWAPAPVTLAYQWKANGAAISGATASTYKLAAADLGKAITVTVTGSKSGYTTAAKTSAATGAVGAGALATAVPAISGTAKVGATLTAVPGTWAPAPVTLAYQWKANGAAISGATASTYKLAAADLGKTVTVTVTGSKSGYAAAAKSSAATAKVGAGVLATAVPTISGTARVGYTLTALPRTWGPAPVTLRYQWRANGVAIKGATASKFKPSAALRGKALTVTLTGSKAGYTTVAKTSIATARLR